MSVGRRQLAEVAINVFYRRGGRRRSGTAAGRDEDEWSSVDRRSPATELHGRSTISLSRQMKRWPASV